MTDTQRATTPEQKRDVIERLYALWLTQPHLRLGQLLANAFRDISLYYAEDSTVIESLKRYYSTINADLSTLYRFRDARHVQSFLIRYPFLTPLLHEAHTSIKQYFPESACVLQVEFDPETGYVQLALLIQVPASTDVEQASDALKRFDSAWWLDAQSRTQGKVLITLEFLKEAAL